MVDTRRFLVLRVSCKPSRGEFFADCYVIFFCHGVLDSEKDWWPCSSSSVLRCTLLCFFYIPCRRLSRDAHECLLLGAHLRAENGGSITPLNLLLTGKTGYSYESIRGGQSLATAVPVKNQL